jgi:hypothetical protein
MATLGMTFGGSREYCFRLVCLFLAWLVTISGFSFAQEIATKSFLLLEHGGVLHGVANPVGDQIAVQLEKGNTIYVKKDKVIHISSSKLELYEFQVSSIRRWGENEHWHITQWCVQNELIEQALFHFQELSKIVEPSPKLKQLEHQIKVAILKSEPVQRYLIEQQRALGIVPKEETAVTVSYESPNSGHEVQNAVATNFDMSESEEIRLNEIPSYARKAFQQSITPVLVQRCGQSGCHGLPGKSDFQIYQPIGERAAETSIKNLINVLKHVDTKQPSSSRLVAYATNAHSIQRVPALNVMKDSDQAIVTRIENWIKSIEPASSQSGQFLAGVQPASVALAGTPSMNNIGNTGRRTLQVPPVEELTAPGDSVLSRKELLLSLRNDLGVEDPNARLSKPAKSGGLPPLVDADELAGLERAIERLEQSLTTKNKKDPFDPNEFNNRYGSKQSGSIR